MQPARPATFDRNVAERRGPPINRTLAWFGDEAERRRRAATAAQEALSRPAATEVGWVGLHQIPYAEIRREAQARRAAYLTALTRRTIAWLAALPRRSPPPTPNRNAGVSAAGSRARRRPELFGCVAVAVLVLAMVDKPASNATGLRLCRTDPAVLTPGADSAVQMAVSHRAACAILPRTQDISANDVTITTTPQHGTVALRGRAGVTYRPAGTFKGNDFFAFKLSVRSPTGDKAALVRVDVTVN